MPERIIHWWDSLLQGAVAVFIGIAIGLGQLLASQEKLTPRIIWGRALSTGGISMASGVALVWIPDMPLLAQLGLAAALASLGTSGLERLFQRWIGINRG